MSCERTEGNPKPTEEKVKRPGKVPRFLELEAAEDPVELLSKGFEADLRRILGDRYVERPDRST